MAGNDVRIEQKDLRVARVFIDGNEVKGVQNVNYSIGVDDIPVIRLEFIPETLNFDKDLKVRVNFDGEKLADEVIKQINKKAKINI